MHLPLIEPAREADRAAIVALWRACGLTRPWNDADADLALALDSPGSTVLVARAGEVVAGSIMVGFDGHRGWVYYLAVDPAARRGGIGRSLMTAAEQWLAARGCPKIQLMVRQDNEAALGFYQALGLEPQKVVTLGRFLEKAR